MGSPGKAHPLAPSAAPHNPMATPNSPYDLENSPQPVQKKNTLARTLFFLGFCKCFSPAFATALFLNCFF